MFFIGLGIGLVVGAAGGAFGMWKFIEKRVDKMILKKKAEFEKNLDEVVVDMKGLKKTKVGDLDDALKAIRDKILDWF